MTSGTGINSLTLENVQITDTAGQAQTTTVEGGSVMAGVPQRIYLPLIGDSSPAGGSP